jgi:phosphate transport system substrate-binding protein
LDGQVDFGASDAALTDEQIAQVKRGVQLIPTLAGKVVIAYNLEGLGGALRLKRDVYTDIFLGKITRWNDERIAAINPGLALPDTSIHVIARQDGSGTTFAFTNHLAAISPEWKSTHGVGNKIGWGKASLATGNEGVAALILRTPGGIGYVEYGMAKRTGLAMALLENKAGHFVAPTGSSGQAALANSKLPGNLRAFFPDPEGSDSYPVVTYTWLLLYQQYGDPKKAAAVKNFVRWCLTDGQSYNEALGFIRLTPEVANSGLEALNRIK